MIFLGANKHGWMDGVTYSCKKLSVLLQF